MRKEEIGLSSTRRSIRMSKMVSSPDQPGIGGGDVVGVEFRIDERYGEGRRKCKYIVRFRGLGYVMVVIVVRLARVGGGRWVGIYAAYWFLR